MMLIKTCIKESILPSAGLGCFADEFITKGTKIWELNLCFDRCFDPNQLVLFPELTQLFIKTYSYSYDNRLYLCMDNGRFFNHSIDIYNTYEVIEGDDQFTYAKNDINIGDEIISNYELFGITKEDKLFNLNFI